MPKARCLETSLQDPGSQLTDSPSCTRSRDPLLLTHLQDRTSPLQACLQLQTLSVITEPSLVLICNHLLVIFLHWGWGYLECLLQSPPIKMLKVVNTYIPSSLLHHSSMGCMLFCCKPSLSCLHRLGQGWQQAGVHFGFSVLADWRDFSVDCAEKDSEVLLGHVQLTVRDAFHFWFYPAEVAMVEYYLLLFLLKKET